MSPVDLDWLHNNDWAKEQAQRAYKQQLEALRQAQMAQQPPSRTIGSARVTDGILHLNFTDGSRIDIPMAVVSEIVAVVLAGRLAMGLPEEAK